MSITGRPALIFDALLTRALLMESAGPILPVSAPEPATPFVPPVSPAGEALPYLEVTPFLNDDLWQGLASGRISQGLMQVTVVWPKNQGSIRPAQAAGAVEAFFAFNTAMTSGSVTVRVSRNPWSASPITGEIDVRIPVTIPWTATG
jgi:hypothetical protein